jgi:arginase
VTGFTLIGVPIDSVGRSGGTEHAPAALRELGLAEAVGGTDAGDLGVRIRGEHRDPDTGIVGSADVLATTVAIREAVREAVARGERPFLVGGCCTELPGALAGVRDAVRRVGLAYLDGHLDLYDGVTSPTGEAADMPVSVALGMGPDAWVEACGGATVSPGDVEVLGYRDLEESQTFGMRHPDSVGGLRHVDVGRVRSDGPAIVGAAAAESLSSGFWLHLDVDVLDERAFPATDYLMPGGLELDELVAMMRPLASSPALVGASLGCYNPEKDPDGSNGRALVEIWRAAVSP